MPYQENIPQPNDQLSQSQNDILGNFQAIKTLVDINHVTFGGADQGKHKFLTMPEQGVAPITLANEGALYTTQGAYSGITELKWRPEANGTSVPFTEGINAVSGYSRLPSNLLIKWAAVSISAPNAASAALTITWAVAANIPVFTSVFNVIVTVAADQATPTRDVNVVAYPYDITPTTFKIRQWRRNQFNTPGTDQGPYVLYFVGIGI